MPKITQSNFDLFCENQEQFAEALNHRMSRIEVDVRWMKRLGYYMATLLTMIVIKSVFL